MIESILQAPGAEVSPMVAGEQLARQIGTSEWLGPLAPVALSPFFGIAVLSGLATYGPEFLQQRSGLIADGSPLNNALLFWTMATLAMLTSLPRFSKVSKPFALAVESLESYASVIVLVAVKFLSSAQPGVASGSPEVAIAGVGAIPLDTLMSIAAALNVIVINTVKLFFEFLVWMTPIPAVDALLEICQKSLCLGMMGLYCYSPLLATLLNLLLLTLCAFVFGWVVRKSAYYRHLIVGPALAWLMPSWFAQRGNQFIAYSEQPLGGLPASVPYTIEQISPSEFRIQGVWLWRTYSYHFKNVRAQREPGLLAQRLILIESGCKLSFVHRRFVAGDALNPSKPITV